MSNFAWLIHNESVPFPTGHDDVSGVSDLVYYPDGTAHFVCLAINTPGTGESPTLYDVIHATRDAYPDTAWTFDVVASGSEDFVGPDELGSYTRTFLNPVACAISASGSILICWISEYYEITYSDVTTYSESYTNGAYVKVDSGTVWSDYETDSGGNLSPIATLFHGQCNHAKIDAMAEHHAFSYHRTVGALDNGDWTYSHYVDLIVDGGLESTAADQTTHFDIWLSKRDGALTAWQPDSDTWVQLNTTFPYTPGDAYGAKFVALEVDADTHEHALYPDNGGVMRYAVYGLSGWGQVAVGSGGGFTPLTLTPLGRGWGMWNDDTISVCPTGSSAAYVPTTFWSIAAFAEKYIGVLDHNADTGAVLYSFGVKSYVRWTFI
jgi:hypothetical protein